MDERTATGIPVKLRQEGREFRPAGWPLVAMVAIH